MLSWLTGIEYGTVKWATANPPTLPLNFRIPYASIPNFTIR